MSGQCCVWYAWLDLREAGWRKKGKMERGLGTEGIHFFAPATSQVAKGRNMSIGENRHCCVTFEI